MAGRHPPLAPAPAPPYDLPGQESAQRYGYVPPRRPPRRTAGGLVAAVLGGVAALVVLIVLGFAAFGGEGRIGSRGGDAAKGVPSKASATDNKLYKTGALIPVKCHLPAIAPGSASMRRFMDALSDCLDASWQGQFGKAQTRFAPPKRVFWEGSGRSPCGSYPSPGASAFYCPANNTMYVGLRHVVETSGGEPLSHFAVFARVIAHEYGHHVQDRAGILLYAHAEMERADALARAEGSRRIELQAQCFAGAFLGAERTTLPMTRAQYAAMIADVRGRGDERLPPEQRDHGSGRSYSGWVVKGFKGRALAVCNTWTVPAEAVR
ncbi:neutral zinc metallopeptidase [Actinomadura xylanilytica]|uniref:neutral zinc metallopeptidase n=1 Tax=Actinomadura xylanilytica TaxID=887459 RepID=UPI00255A9BC7|nr:neutral zinc metallopeptidase [Actinomadura xylanilytica]MDL4772796.1 neutral zinc metallopeptidase [Actinomadura xylanilytica]